MRKWLIIIDDYRHWNPADSLALRWIEAAVVKNIDCSTHYPLEPAFLESPLPATLRVKRVLFAEVESACFFGLDRSQESSIADFDAALNGIGGIKLLSLRDSSRAEIARINAKLSKAHHDSFAQLIDEILSLGLNAQNDNNGTS